MEAKSENVKNEHLQAPHTSVSGSICFEVTITATSSAILNKYAKLTVPIWFMREHGTKIGDSVKLISRATGRTWTVDVVTYHPQRQPQVMLCRGWSAFASFNSLVEGDRLTFTLTAMSEFEVFISRMAFPCVSPSSKRVKSSQRVTEPVASPECKAELYMPAERTKKLLMIRCTQPSPTQSNYVFHSACRDGNSSFSKSHLLAPRLDSPWNLIQKKRSHGQPEDAPQKKLQRSLPSFFKKLTRSHCSVLEIPCIFARTYGILLDTFVTLRWMHDESPVYNVACTRRMDRDKRRISLADGWKEFKTDNGLQTGQELEFTLIADSSFVVSPRVG